MKAISESAHSRQHCNRRSALSGAAACAADPGLAAIEVGYERWQALTAEYDRLKALASDFHGRAYATADALAPPKPERAPEIAKLISEDGAFELAPSAIPRALRKKVETHHDAMNEWRRARNVFLDDNADYEACGDADEEANIIGSKADDLRLAVLAMPATSALGLHIKVAIAMEARSLDEIAARLAEPSVYGVYDGWVCEDLLPVLAADLRRMVGAPA